MIPQRLQSSAAAVWDRAAVDRVSAIAYQAGRALETVLDGQSGIFFGGQTTESLIAAMLRFERTPFDPDRVRVSVARFDVEPFKRDLRDFVLNTASTRGHRECRTEDV